MTPDARHQSALLPLDEGLYRLDSAEITFLKQQIGIDDDDELKTHLLSIQAEAYKVYPYPCIRLFSWARPGVSRLFPYQNLLKLGREREGAILLDIGCCFGTDVRKAIADGFPLRNVVASDLHQGFWDLGHKLFRTTPDTFPVTFLPGDVFDPEHLSIVSPFTANSPPLTTVPDLGTLTSLNPLRGHVSAIYASSFFHLFPEDAQLRLARALAGLLSPEPSSMIFGKHIGLPESGHREDLSPRVRLFCHTPRSWSGLWDGGVFPKGTVKVLAFVTEVPKERVANIYPEANSLHLLTWSVTRL
ncbi:hypothetical protein EDB85DRAFT_1908860 [Lactarius pseudohatsudake]|nr:hypothetical protein EDB85DRAFT_1908860 [Lactarius pseudohatsudake]